MENVSYNKKVPPIMGVGIIKGIKGQLFRMFVFFNQCFFAPRLLLQPCDGICSKGE